mmetsp:Transcript_32793/g.82623  ORF Transcript_32793/g.82623 Transcript_32793/m.82623 type:complete len:818 (+) Transcript_32793:258-2711(+)
MDSKEVPIMGAIPSVIEHHVSVVLQNHVSIHVNRPEDDCVGVAPIYMDSILQSTGKHSPMPPPAGRKQTHLSDDLYQKLISSCLACWESDCVTSLPGRIALCDWVSRALKVSAPLHHAAMSKALESNAHIVNHLHQRLRLLNDDLNCFSSDFRSAEGSSSYRFQEITDIEALLKNKLKHPETNGLLEVAVLNTNNINHKDTLSYVELSLRGGGKRRTRMTSLAPRDSEDGPVVWAEKVKSYRVTQRDGALNLKVRSARSPGALSHAAAKNDVGNSKSIMSAVRIGAARVASKSVWKGSVSLVNLKRAILATPLAVNMRKASQSASADSPAAMHAGQLKVIVRYVEEHNSSTAHLKTTGTCTVPDEPPGKPKTSGLMDPPHSSKPPGITGDEFDAVLECMWRAWADSVEFYGIHDSEVADELHEQMASRGDTFQLERADRDIASGTAPGEEESSRLTYATGAAISPGIPGHVAELVTDVQLRGFSPDHSWWVVVQRFCTMYRVRRRRCEIGVLSLLIDQWHLSFGYLRALRGVFQPLIGSARRQELSVREEDLLRTCNLRISNLIEFTLRNGTQDLLSFSFDEAAAAFRELQRLLLLSCAGDECAWSDEIDQITFQLLATGAVARLREGLPEDPTDTNFAGVLSRNLVIANSELQVDTILRHAYLGEPDFCQFNAYMRYTELLREVHMLLKMSSDSTPESPLEYSAAIQLVEDKLHEHHEVLRNEKLLDEQRQLLDPLGAMPPLGIFNIVEAFTETIEKWIDESKSLVLSCIEIQCRNWLAGNSVGVSNPAPGGPLFSPNHVEIIDGRHFVWYLMLCI